MTELRNGLLTKGGERPPLLLKHEVVDVSRFCEARQHVPGGRHLLTFERIHRPKL